MNSDIGQHAVSPDLTDRTARYLVGLGILHLISLNLAGFLYLEMAKRIRSKSNGWRIATIWICGIQAFAGVAIFGVALFDPSKLHLKIYSSAIDAPIYLTMILALVMMTAFGLSTLWLNSRGTRLAFKRANAPYLYRHLCRSCGYDLRATPDRCPECGTIVQRISGQ